MKEKISWRYSSSSAAFIWRATTRITLFSHLSYAFSADGGGDNDHSLGTLDANLGIEVDAWSVKVWSKNLLDARDYDGYPPAPGAIDAARFVLGENIAPRTLGVTATYNFGDR